MSDADVTADVTDDDVTDDVTIVVRFPEFNDVIDDVIDDVTLVVRRLPGQSDGRSTRCVTRHARVLCVRA